MRATHASNQRGCNGGTADTEGIRDLSAKLAANRLLVQASTGNTSVKTGDTLWIKASGKWLADATAPDFLTPVALSRARMCLDAEGTIPETEKTSGACASIETAMHAVLPHKVVIHVHSVNAIAWAVRSDAANALGSALGDFSWRWIPYTTIGVPLAKRMQEAIALTRRRMCLSWGIMASWFAATVARLPRDCLRTSKDVFTWSRVR